MLLMFTYQSLILNATENLFKYAGGRIWNHVPNNILNAPSVEGFKYAYK